ncbi:MAG: aminotransferase class III-fold pyridoxal phosphate-dependent enzyme [Actinobacteria bacterium]|nr:aminotransferase class III-fold pyridoxal phosphate-dependent enzyme [Actinomycetota bacterium]MCB9411574.1 aminotransferase class III-fold pyridoxal phosphate-dependent enzyme [Actinomycetota bacterium]
MVTIDRSRLSLLLKRERGTHIERNPRSRQLFGSADHLFGRVPMTWMNKWAGGFPVYLEQAYGNRIVDVDGNTYIDFSLGDTAAMSGHSPAPAVAAITHRAAELGGVTTMLPTSDAERVAAELTRRFGLPLWSFTLTATDANRWALRLARLATGRPKVLAFSYSYHGSCDETLAVLDPDSGQTINRPGNVGPQVDVSETTRAAEFNDLDSVERALAHGDVAVVITEPALTNIGIVLPEPGFLEGLRELCDAHSTLLLIDETHTFSVGPGGATAAWDLRPDILVIGKAIGGGVPSGAYGITAELAGRVATHPDADLVDVGGVGGTLAGNALSTAAMRATLGEVLTDDAFGPMIDLGGRFAAGVREAISRYELPWSVTQLGARAEYRFADPPPRTGTEAAQAGDDDLEQYLHLYLSNRGVLITPFHNMALMCPATTIDDVDRHTELFDLALADLLG